MYLHEVAVYAQYIIFCPTRKVSMYASYQIFGYPIDVNFVAFKKEDISRHPGHPPEHIVTDALIYIFPKNPFLLPSIFSADTNIITQFPITIFCIILFQYNICCKWYDEELFIITDDNLPYKSEYFQNKKP